MKKKNLTDISQWNVFILGTYTYINNSIAGIQNKNIIVIYIYTLYIYFPEISSSKAVQYLL